MQAGSRRDRPLVILGATASGKSALALALADEVGDVELISIDSMQVYRGMDIGTATPTPAQRSAVPHHLLDLVEPTISYTVHDFQAAAREALADVRHRGAQPILVGGTGLYLRAVIDDLEFPGQFPDVRAELETESNTERLHARLARLDPVAARRTEPSNRRRVVRALEVTLGTGRPFSSFGPGLQQYRPTRFVQVALRWPREVLNERIARRYDQQLEAGFLAEVEALAATGASRTAAQALGYRELLAHLAGECTLEEAVTAAITRTRQFARRQERWFRRDPRVRWVDAPADTSEVLRIWDEVRRCLAS